MKNVLITVLVIAVLVFGYLQFKPKTDATISPAPVVPSGQTTTINNPNGKDYQPANTQSSIEWLKSSNAGLYYPKGSTITEGQYLGAAQKANGESGGVTSFSFTYKNFIIRWGGAQSGCSQQYMGAFEYGVSTEACVQGLTAGISPSNPTYKLTTEDKKLFGDFVLKNK